MRSLKKILFCVLSVAIISSCLLLLSSCFEKVNCSAGHTWGEWSETTPATCESKGKQTRTCSVCEQTEEQEIDMLSHQFTSYVSNNDASCTADGTKTAKCDNCDATDTVADAGTKKSHSFTNYVSGNNASCTADGTKTAKCDNCDETDTVADTGSMKGHSFTNYVSNNNATCTSYGTETATCDNCTETSTRNLTSGEYASHSFTNYVSNNDATCTADGTKTAKCDNCEERNTVADTGSMKGHSFTNYVSNNDASCTADGTKTAKCDNCDETDTVADTDSKKEHSFGTYVYNNDATCESYGTESAVCLNGCGTKNTRDLEEGTYGVHVYTTYSYNNDATCLEDGTETAICDVCHSTDEDKVNTRRKTDSKLGHDWDNDEVTCESGRSCQRVGCGANEPALTHSYPDAGTTVSELTCTTDYVVRYTCTNGDCGHYYDETVEEAQGHTVDADAWSETGREKKDGETCVFVVTYTGECSECHEDDTKTDEVTSHAYGSTITTPATCQTAGVKTYKCTNEGCNDAGYTDEIPASANAHNWKENGVADNTTGLTNYKCDNANCDATKQMINASNVKQVEVSKDALGEGGVKLEDADIVIDSETLTDMKNTGDADAKIEISADQTPASEILDSSDPKLAQLGSDTPIYNFGITIGGEPYKPEGGFAGKVTVRIPVSYTLEDIKDMDTISIWYITEEGVVSDDPFEASIEIIDGQVYAVFETNHFSYYTVTRLTPEERCALYNHEDVDTVVAPTCMFDGYTVHTCQRCGRTEKVIDLGSKLGHDINTVTTPATCEVAGSTVHTCEREGCTYTKTVVIKATGHDLEITETVAATCESSGYTISECQNEGCGETFKAIIAQKSHYYKDTVTAPTCTEGGYTTKVCELCDNTVVTNHKAPLNHSYTQTAVSANCATGEQGYTLHQCIRCDDNHKTDYVDAQHTWNIEAPTCGEGQVCTVCSATGKPATGEHTFADGVCSVCGDGCEHSFTSSVIEPDCVTGGYTLKTCEKCSATQKVDYTDPAGHLYEDGAIVCSVCEESLLPNGFYTNLLKTASKKNLALYIDEFVFTKDMEVPFYAMRSIEFSLGLDDNGKFYGYASLYLQTTKDSTDRYPVMAYINDNKIYMQVDPAISGEGGVTNNMYAIVPLDVIFYEMGAPITGLSSIIEWAATDLLAFFEACYAGDEYKIEEAARTIVPYLFSVTKDGANYVLTLDFEKIAALNDMLAEMTVSEFIDEIFGEGAFDELVLNLLATLDMTVGEILDSLADDRENFEELVASLNNLMMTLTGAEKFDIISMISSMLPPKSEEEMYTLEEFLALDEVRSLVIGNLLIDAGYTAMDMIKDMMGGSGDSVDPNAPSIETSPDGNYKEDSGDYTEGDNGYTEGDNGYTEGDGNAEGDGTSSETPEVKKMTLEELKAMISGFAEGCKEATLYEMVGMDAEMAEGISTMINALADMYSLTITTEADGTAMTIELIAAIIIPGGSSEEPDPIIVDLVMDFNYETEIDYELVKSEAERITVLSGNGTISGSEEIIHRNEQSDNYKNSHKSTIDYEIVFDENGKPVAIVITEVEEEYSERYEYDSYEKETGKDEYGNIQYEQVRVTYKYVNEHVYKYVYTIDLLSHPEYMVAAYKDCSGWYNYSLLAYGNRAYTSESNSSVYVNGVLIEGMSNSSTSSGASDGMHSIDFFYNAKLGKIKMHVEGGSMHKLVENKDGHIEAEGCTGIGRNEYFCTECGEASIEYYTNGHGYSYPTVELVNPDGTCEDGTIVSYICMDCGEVVHSYEDRNHHPMSYTPVELSSIPEDMCETHKFFLAKCACGHYNTQLAIFISHEMYGTGISTIGEGFTCDCGLSVTVNVSTALVEGTTCEFNVTRSYTVKFIDDVLYQHSITHQTTEHQEVVTRAELEEGASNCEEGVITWYECLGCGTTYNSYSTRKHVNAVIERFYFADAGAVCDGYFEITGCPCGEEKNGHMNSKCNFAATSEYIEQDGRWDYRKDTYTCAVTDPTLCGFTYTYETYYHMVDTCTSAKCIVYTFGEGENKKVYTFENNYSTTHSNSATTSTNEYEEDGLFVRETTVKYACEKCGIVDQIDINKNYYNDAEHTKEVKRISSLNYYYDYTNNILSHSYVHTDERFTYGDFTDMLTVSSEYTYYNTETGEISNFEGFYYEYDECYCTRTTRHIVNGRELKSTTEHNNYLHSTQQTTKPATCTQDGITSYTCHLCEGVYDEIINAIQHRYTAPSYDEALGCEVYTCTICGLKNFVGVNGSVVLENCTGENEHLFIVGYYTLKEELKYDCRIALILKNQDGREVYIESIEVFDYNIGGGRYKAFRRADVIAWATSNGYELGSYDIRISFVPTNYESDLDYAITFEASEFDGEIPADCEAHSWESTGRCMTCGACCSHENRSEASCNDCGMAFVTANPDNTPECEHLFSFSNGMVSCTKCGYMQETKSVA